MSQPNSSNNNNNVDPPPTPSTPLFQTPRPTRLPSTSFVHSDQFTRPGPAIETIVENTSIEEDQDEYKYNEIDTNNNNNTTDNINNNSEQIQNNNNHNNQNTNQNTNSSNVNLPQLNEYILQIEQQKQIYEQQLQQQQQEIAHLRYQQAWNYQQQGQQNPQNMHAQLFKSLAKPDVFYGNPGEDLDSWLAQIINYVKLTGIPLNVAAQFSSTYLKGAAWTWFSSLTQEELITITNLDTFVTAISKRFKPLDNQHIARMKLTTLAQLASVAKYNEMFNTIMQQLPKMDIEDRKFQYINKLKDTIRTALAATVQPHHSLVEIQLMALKLDAALTQPRGNYNNNNNKFQRNTNGNNYNNANKQHNSSAQWNTKPVATANVINASNNSNNTTAVMSTEQTIASTNDMNYYGIQDGDDNNMLAHLHNMNMSRTSTIPKLTPETRDYCRRNRLCFRCRRPGHMATNCTTNNNNNNNTFNNRLQPSSAISKK